MKFRFIDNWLKGRFRGLGQAVGRHPVPFIILPILASIFCSTGMLDMRFTTDQEYLVTPVNGASKKEKAIAEKFFPTNYSDYDASRSFELGLYGYAMVTAKNGHSSILKPEVWREVRQLEEIIKAISVEHEGRRFTYQDICAKWAGKCYTNGLLSYADTFAVLSEGGNIYRSGRSMSGFHNDSEITGLSKPASVKVMNDDEIKKNHGSQTQRGLPGLLVDIIDLNSRHKGQGETSLPGYFGGITVQNQSIENFDICQFLLASNNTTSGDSSDGCMHPFEILSTLSDISSDLTIADINTKIKSFYQRNIKEPAEGVIALVTNVSSALEGLVKNVEKLTNNQLKVNKMLRAEAVLIGGLIDSDTFPEVGELWENKFLQTINELEKYYRNIDVGPMTSNSLRVEMETSVRRLKPVMSLNILIMVIFCMLICCTNQVTTSKPWVGLAGVISTLAGSAAGFGLCVYAGADFTSFNFAAIFILLGIGMDSTFMLLNAWHRTDRKASVPERMGETMAEAGVSILITNTTNILSFLIAISAPYPYVKIFCLYTGVCLLIVFLLHITFFAGCLACSGYMEEQGRSGLTLRKVAEEKLILHRKFLCLRKESYSINKTQEEKRQEEKRNNDNLAELLGKALRSRTLRLSVLVLYICYICVCIFGICNVVVFFDKTNLINYDSPMKKFVKIEQRLFKDKFFSISAIVTGNINYSDPESLTKIEDFLSRLEDSVYINEHLTKSWLKDFQTMKTPKITKTAKQTEEEFVRLVHSLYSDENSTYHLDLAFNSDFTRIEASRFLIQGQNIRTTIDQENMVTELREICNEINTQSSMKVSVYNGEFPYTDQYLTIFDQSIQTILLTGVIVVGVSLVLLPDPISALSAIFSIISTLAGCLGLMSIWGIVLDGTTLISLIMCIGFSVDFSAHFCYNFIEHRHTAGLDQRQVVERTMLCVYKPVLQGALSTLLGVMGMLFAPSYAFIIFFKVIFIVISLSLFHSLIVVPLFVRFILDVSEAGKEDMLMLWNRGIFALIEKKYQNKTILLV